MKRWKRVSFETDEPVGPGPLIKIFDDHGTVVATVTRYEWFELDAHQSTGYIDAKTGEHRTADAVIAALVYPIRFVNARTVGN
jgi:hypothetical protein